MALDKLVDSTQLDADLTTVANAIRTKGGTSAQLSFPQGMAQAIEDLPSGGITPTGSITLTEENTYDVTEKATAVVDFSATRANLAEAVTAKGVDTLPTSSFDTITTNIGMIEGGESYPVLEIETSETINTNTFIQTFVAPLTSANSASVLRISPRMPGTWELMWLYSTNIQNGTPAFCYARINAQNDTAWNSYNARPSDNVILQAGEKFLIIDGAIF